MPRITPKKHKKEAFPEVAAVEFLGSFFGVQNNVITVATYSSCSDHEASIRYLEKHNISQMSALAELMRALRLAEYESVLCGDVNASRHTLSITSVLREMSLNSAEALRTGVHGLLDASPLALTLDGSRAARN